MERPETMVTVRPVGEDGNAHAILHHVREAMRRAGLPEAEVEAFATEATSSDYDNLLPTYLVWVDVIKAAGNEASAAWQPVPRGALGDRQLGGRPVAGARRDDSLPV